jgi:hypothetical protein
MHDTVRPSGQILLTLRKRGRDPESMSLINTVVPTGRDLLAQLLSGQGGAPVTKAAFGTCGDADAEPHPVVFLPITRISFPGPGLVTFAFTLGEAEANGLELSELLLMSADDTVFARKVRTSIAKTDDLALDGEWTIRF